MKKKSKYDQIRLYMPENAEFNIESSLFTSNLPKENKNETELERENIENKILIINKSAILRFCKK